MAMLTTIDGKKIVTRPMSTQEMGDDGTLWFITSVDSNKVRELESNASVGIAYADSGSECYVSISGTAQVSNDRELIHKFWNPFYKAWFEGPEDPSIRVLEVHPVSAEYWDTKGGKIVSLVSMFASAITGKDMEAGENKEVSL
jgi:general stress protein 26